jgi:Poly(R)-hydroxyalkanoic acid synthase subunit (PHA_synth_III_E)
MSSGPTESKGNSTPLWEPLNQSWTASLSLWSAWADAWQSLLTKRGAPAAKAMVDQFANPASWPGGLASLGKELEDILALPRFADLPGLDPGALPSFAPAVELMGVAQQYLLAVAPIWAKVCERFQAEVAERRQRGDAIDNAGEAMDLWNNTLDQTLMEFNRSADFAKLQQRFLHAAMRQRLEVRKLAEQAAKAVDMPTRTEIDDVYRRLHDLTREVHGLRRELRTLRQSAPDKGRAATSNAQGS